MSNPTIVVEILTGISFFIYGGLHLQSIPDFQKYREIYKLMNRDVYKYEPHVGHGSLFRLYDYDIRRVEFIPVSDCIVFFPDGDLKLDENLYIHKSTRYGNLFRWYYYNKFCKLRDEKVDIYNWREMRERYSQLRHDAYMRPFRAEEPKKEFKFLN
jgi:hypothetical protein